MGYMGFGMQKWIYSSRPRKFLSKERKQAGNTLDTGLHSHDVFGGNPGETSLRSSDPSFVNREKNYKKIRNIILVVIVCVIVLLYFIL